MKATLSNLKKAVEAAGGVLEEDESGRDIRRFQMVAPDNKRWAASACQCQPVQWAKRAHLDSAKKFNQISFDDAIQQLGFGLEEIPEDEKYIYAVD